MRRVVVSIVGQAFRDYYSIDATREEGPFRDRYLSTYPIHTHTHTRAHIPVYTRATCLVYLVHTRKRKHGLRVGEGIEREREGGARGLNHGCKPSP